MGAKENILRKVRILITNEFDSPAEALSFFDSEHKGKLNKSEIKKILRDAEASGFLSFKVANELLQGYDKYSHETISWEEFKKEIAILDKDL